MPPRQGTLERTTSRDKAVILQQIQRGDGFPCNTMLLSHSLSHYTDAIMGAMAFQITSIISVYSTVYSGADQRKHRSFASLAFVWGIHRGPVNSPHKWPVTRKMFPFDDVFMAFTGQQYSPCRRPLEQILANFSPSGIEFQVIGSNVTDTTGVPNVKCDMLPVIIYMSGALLLT